VNCIVRGNKLEIKVCEGKNRRKAVMLFCPIDGRNFRGSINDPKVVEGVSRHNVPSMEALIQ